MEAYKAVYDEQKAAKEGWWRQLFSDHLRTMGNVNRELRDQIMGQLQANIRFQATNVLLDKLPGVSLCDFINTIKTTDEELMKEREVRLFTQFVQQCLMEYFRMCAKVVTFDAMQGSEKLSDWLEMLQSHSKKQQASVLEAVGQHIDNHFRRHLISELTKRYKAEVQEHYVPQCSAKRILEQLELPLYKERYRDRTQALGNDLRDPSLSMYLKPLCIGPLDSMVTSLEMKEQRRLLSELGNVANLIESSMSRVFQAAKEVQPILHLEKARFHQQLMVLIEEGTEKHFHGKLQEAYNKIAKEVLREQFLHIYCTKNNKKDRVNALGQMLPSAAADIVHNLLNELKTMLTSLAKHMSHEIKELVNLTFKRFSKYSQEDLEELQNENIVQKCQDDLWLCCQYIKLLVETNTFQSTQIFSGPNDNMLYESTVKTQDPSRAHAAGALKTAKVMSPKLKSLTSLNNNSSSRNNNNNNDNDSMLSFSTDKTITTATNNNSNNAGSQRSSNKNAKKRSLDMMGSVANKPAEAKALKKQVCANCAVTTTPRWRMVDNKTLCNACGLYWSKYKAQKPLKNVH